ncbi:acylphosphatase [Paraburkholderia caballeronis]|uniref:Acylphosphatase n=1 Tax=Paraburkholderia caballeronis TaxID=416943 RepID=A0A1H7VRT8_9BURK|nr:acylphosphatase [Paraburkholderia caballeronis]PXW15489.1 acylphosphatase [Paraburkholderia caballeronis]PXW93774.1 acylphosphatase [Paraburkholderia caballeronis]RAJ89014.1 acylphosphatase [Paraburkholderia caballeronis]TDV05079.1 acylphosphatase [Paraburkholderia caballeronis]TDV08226.1 acylphosphatase [Paraburkholderia caballeronis]
MTGPDLDSRIETYYVRVRGTVQGVGFRHATVRQAHALRIRGYVANLEDGSVEAVIQGPANEIDRMLSWLRRGPPAARVTDLVSEERSSDKRYERFEQH